MILAKKLKTDYKVLASFYSTSFENLGFVTCRNVCDIYRNSNENLLADIDAYFIMMNPGSCLPHNKEYKIKSYQEVFNNREIVECNPDPAQYQIMRLMENKKWNHVRILNLSDLRSGNSNEFIKMIKKATNFSHSIFSEERSEELNSLMKIDKNTNVYAAWGINNQLLNLARLCKRRISVCELKGISKDIHNELYYYIKPMTVSKQEEMLMRLSEIV